VPKGLSRTADRQGIAEQSRINKIVRAKTETPYLSERKSLQFSNLSAKFLAYALLAPAVNTFSGLLSEKGKPSERVGRKATDLTPVQPVQKWVWQDMVAGLPE
jgi:hypothetical protein